MKTILIIFGLVGLMAVAAFFLTQKVIKPMMAERAIAEQAEAIAEEADSKKAEEDDDEEVPELGEIYLVPDILVNPTGTGGTRYLSATIGLEVHDPEAVLALQHRDVQVRDILISILSARSVDQLTDFQAREQMRREIRFRIDKLIGADQLSAVYFVDYVLQ